MLHRKTVVFILTLLLSAPVYAFAPATKAERACESTAQCAVVAYGCDGTVSVNELAKASVTARYHKKHGNPVAINCIKTAYHMGPAVCTKKQCEIPGSNMGILFNLPGLRDTDK